MTRNEAAERLRSEWAAGMSYEPEMLREALAAERRAERERFRDAVLSMMVSGPAQRALLAWLDKEEANR